MAITLCFDVGGTHVKAAALAEDGSVASPAMKERTPRPATPEPLLDVMSGMAARVPSFDRVSIGFPGVVEAGVTLTAPNLDHGWEGFPLASALGQRLGKPVRVCNDADMAGLAAIEGRGLEMAITLGTGMGSAVYADGRLAPNLELGHHPFGDGRSYEERVSDAELARIGEQAWKERVRENLAQIRRTWNFRKLYLGGGNARLFRQDELPADVILVDNAAGVLGGLRLWDTK